MNTVRAAAMKLTSQPVYYWKDSPAISGMAFISATFLCRDGINCLSAR
ncbi:hypothetical protein NN767_000060 [Salmonella enterica]|nr:hypothetical protein [Salmonella enterica]